MRKIEVQQNKNGREGKRNRMAVRGVGVKGKAAKEEVKKLWGKDGNGGERDKGGNKYR